MSPAEVVIAGGGVAGLEAVMALRELAQDRVRITLVSPAADFVYRPLSVAQPFGLGEARRYPLVPIADDFGVRLVRGTVTAVDAAARSVRCADDAELGFDSLLLATGVQMSPGLPGAVSLGAPGGEEGIRALLDDLRAGVVRRVAFVVPALVGWPLPLYELALMTARDVRGRGLDVELQLVSPEQRPLAVFGEQASRRVGVLLDAAGIAFTGGARPHVRAGRLETGRGDAIAAERIVATPAVRAHELSGLPAQAPHGFLRTDRHGRVIGFDGIYAAGDVTDFPLKQGGLAAQQADAAAAHVAAHHGFAAAPAPFRPVLRGMLFTGTPEAFFATDLRAVGPAQRSATAALWWPPGKVAGRLLAPYLARRDAGPAVPAIPRGFTDVAVPVDATAFDG